MAGCGTSPSVSPHGSQAWGQLWALGTGEVDAAFLPPVTPSDKPGRGPFCPVVPGRWSLFLHSTTYFLPLNYAPPLPCLCRWLGAAFSCPALPNPGPPSPATHPAGAEGAVPQRGHAGCFCRHRGFGLLSQLIPVQRAARVLPGMAALHPTPPPGSPSPASPCPRGSGGCPTGAVGLPGRGVLATHPPTAGHRPAGLHPFSLPVPG